MNRAIGILLSFLFAGCSPNSLYQIEQIRGRIIEYGEYSNVVMIRRIKSPSTNSGYTKILEDPQVIGGSSDMINAKIGTVFGIRYEISNLPTNIAEIEVLRVVRYPPMTMPDGRVSTGFSYVERPDVENGFVRKWSGYSFDWEYEIVEGDWEIEIQYKGKTLCSQKFIISSGLK